MIEALTKAISIALHGEFGDSYKNYTEEVRQGLKEPCFFISCVHPTYTLFRGSRYRKENQFCIQYFPKNPCRAQEESNQVAERLFACLEIIRIDNRKIRGTKMEYEEVDGILNFFVHYDVFVQKQQDLVPMEELLETFRTKGVGTENGSKNKAGRR